jgi:hypothetical protein
MVEVSINALPTVVANSTATAICDTDMITLTGSGADTYAWDNGATDGVAFDPATTTTFTVTGTDANGCTNTDMITVTVNPLPTVSMTAIAQVCVYDVAFDLTGGSPAGGSYAGTGVANDQFDPATAGVGTHTITYSYTDGNGCSNGATTDIVVDACSSLEEIAAPFISVYPNPSFGNVTINTNITDITSVEVIDLTGKVLINSQSTTIDLTELPSGKYIVRVSTNDSIHRTTVIKK